MKGRDGVKPFIDEIDLKTEIANIKVQNKDSNIMINDYQNTSDVVIAKDSERKNQDLGLVTEVNSPSKRLKKASIIKEEQVTQEKVSDYTKFDQSAQGNVVQSNLSVESIKNEEQND